MVSCKLFYNLVTLKGDEPMIHAEIVSRETIICTDTAMTEVVRTKLGYYIVMTSSGGNRSYTFKKITKKTHDLLIKAIGENT